MRRRFLFQRAALFVAVLLACMLSALLITGCDESEPATSVGSPPVSGELTLQMTSPEEGASLRINLVKVTGTVSDTEAAVTVNGAEARVNEDGTFYAFLDLSPGENTNELPRGRAAGYRFAPA